MLLLREYIRPMGVQNGEKRFLHILLICLYTLSSASKSTVDDGSSKREVIINGQKNPICPPGYAQQDFHPTHERAVPEESLQGLSYSERQELRSGRKRRSAEESPAGEVEEGSLDRRRELYNEFLRKVLRGNRHGKEKKEKGVSNSEEKSETGPNVEKSKSSPTSSSSADNRDRSLGEENQVNNKSLVSGKALPTSETHRSVTLSPEQRDVRRQLLIKRNKKERLQMLQREDRRQILIRRNKQQRLQRLRKLHLHHNTTRSRKAFLKDRLERENTNRGSFPPLSTNHKRRPKQRYTHHEMSNSTRILTTPTVNSHNSIGRKPKFQENNSNRRKGRNKGKENVSVQRGEKADGHAIADEPTTVNPFISAHRANDYLTSLDSVAERKKYSRRVILKNENVNSTEPTSNTLASRSSSRRSARLVKKKKGNKIEPTNGAKFPSRGRFRLERTGVGRSTRITKNDKKRIRRIRQNRLKLKKRKRRMNRKRKRRNRKSRSRHKISSPSPLSTSPLMTSASENGTSSTQSNNFSSVSKRLQTENKYETSTASFILTTKPDRNTTSATSSTSLETPKESENVSQAFRVSPPVNSSNDDIVIKDMQVTSEPDFQVNNSTRVNDTNDKAIKCADESNCTSSNNTHPTDALNLLPKLTTTSSFPAKVSTANALGEVSRAINLAQMPNDSMGTDVGNSQALGNGSANQLYYNTSIGSMPYNESHPLHETDFLDLNDTSTTTNIQTDITEQDSTAERLLPPSTTIGTNTITLPVAQISHGATLNVKDKSTAETKVFTDVSKLATTQVSLSSPSSLGASPSHNENKSTTSEKERQLSSRASDKETSTFSVNSENKETNYDNSLMHNSSLPAFPIEMSSSTTSSTPILSSSLSQSQTTMSPYASRWIAWAKRRRKKSKNGSKSRAKSKQTSQKRRGMAQGSVALALAKAEKEDSSQLASSRQPITEPTTTKGPFIGYKTAYDFLSNQKGLKVSVLNENRRESRDINKFMGENMCEIFNKHYVPTRIGGKCV